MSARSSVAVVTTMTMQQQRRKHACRKRCSDNRLSRRKKWRGSSRLSRTKRRRAMIRKSRRNSCARSRKKKKTGRGKSRRLPDRGRPRNKRLKIRTRNNNNRNSLTSSERMNLRETPESTSNNKTMMRKMNAWPWCNNSNRESACNLMQAMANMVLSLKRPKSSCSKTIMMMRSQDRMLLLLEVVSRLLESSALRRRLQPIQRMLESKSSLQKR
jgi:hypothetical protein